MRSAEFPGNDGVLEERKRRIRAAKKNVDADYQLATAEEVSERL